MSSTVQKIVELISKPSELRTEKEINSILFWFNNFFKQKVDVFGEIKIESIYELIKKCELRRWSKNDLIIRQGDIGDCFYILLSGRVSVYIDDKHDDIEIENEYDVQREKLGSFVTQLEVGKAFGEISLINDATRIASIIADETTSLMVVNKSLYFRCLKIPMLRKHEEKKTFISQNPFFENFTTHMKKMLFLCLEREFFLRDSYIVRQGDLVNRFYFITRGKAKVIVNENQHREQYPTYMLDKFYTKSQVYRHRLSYRDAELIHQKQRLDIAEIGPSIDIGLCEILLGLPTFIESVKCIENCSVFYIYRQNYNRIIRKNQVCVDLMMKSIQLRLEQRFNRVPIQLYEKLTIKLDDKILRRKFSNDKLMPRRRANSKNSKTLYPIVRIRDDSRTDNRELTHQIKEILDSEGIGDSALNELEDKIKEWYTKCNVKKPRVCEFKRISFLPEVNFNDKI